MDAYCRMLHEFNSSKFKNMKVQTLLSRAIYALPLMMVLASCNKNDSVNPVGNTSTSSIIAAASTASTSGSTDSIYLLQKCYLGISRDSITQSSLPAAVTNYITANYNGAGFSKAYALK